MDLEGSTVPSSMADKKQSKRKKTSGQFSQLSSKQVFKQWPIEEVIPEEIEGEIPEGMEGEQMEDGENPNLKTE